VKAKRNLIQILLLCLALLPATVQAQFQFVTNNGAITITDYTGSGGAVTIPSSTNGYPVTGIGDWAFCGTGLTSVTMGTNVTSIGDYAFSWCTGLTGITIPNSVTNIGDNAFYYCTGLTSVTIGTSVTSIGDGAFSLCISLTSVTIGTNVTNIGDRAFYYCTGLTSVTIGTNVTSIGDYAFYDCTGLTAVYFQGNAPSIGSYVFYGDNNVNFYYLANTVVARDRILLDSGWRFELGDPPDVLTNPADTNVTYYPEIPDLTKLDDGSRGSWDPQELTGPNSETYMETIRIDSVAHHVGENVSFVQTNYNDSGTNWQQINLPHDWVVGLPFDPNAAQNHGYKAGISGWTSANTIAWYRHTFTLPANDAGQALWLEFDGVYRNCLVWLNGHILGRNVSGYDSFSFDVTPYANPGGTNVLVVRVDASRFEGWFYEGAGIYRHVWLTSANPVHVAYWGTYVATTALAGSNATIAVQTMVTNQSGVTTTNGSLTSTILDANSNAVTAVTSNLTLTAGQALVVTQTLAVANANLWSLQTPYLYNLVSTVSNQNVAADVYTTPFGVRMVSINSTDGVFIDGQGVYINGQHVEIQGMCNHQDMAGVGSALPDRL
jgi:hypothetical protein